MISWLSAAALAAVATADPPSAARHDLKGLLAKPVSPGVIALLVPHVADDRASRRIVEALRHPDAPVRAAAARAATVADLRDAGAALRLTLDSETDRAAAAEQLRAVVLLTPPVDDLALVPVAAKHGLIDVLAYALASARGPAALRMLEALRGAGLTGLGESSFIATATRLGREGVDGVAAAAMRAGDARTWSLALSLAREARAPFSPALLLEALGSSKPDIRAPVYWHLAVTLDANTTLSSDMDAALARTPEAASLDSAEGYAAFAFILLQRARKGVQIGGDWGERAAAATPVNPLTWVGDRKALARLLTPAEARAISLRITHGHDEKMFEHEATAREMAGTYAEEYGALSFAGGLPPGTLRDILAVTGCRPAAGIRAMGIVDYRADGRPRRISVDSAGLSRGCAEAAGPTLGMTLAPPGLADVAHPERRTVVIVPLDKEALSCADEPEPAAAEPVPDGGDGGAPRKVSEPRKVKNVAPWYPDRAKREGRQGAVILVAVISSTGCVRSARVVRGVSPDLDAVAMIAVGQWRYSPTLLDGRPVPVIMTVTVNFRLTRR
jgi:TonB family protein